MALTYSLAEELSSVAPDFQLPATDGKTYSLRDFSDARILTVIFICNHCPYVIAVQDRIIELVKEFGPRGMSLIGINSNDVSRYPDDNFEEMKNRSREKKYPFVYAIDESQETAKAYRAVCTPDPYVYENVHGQFLLRYHGRIDDNWKDPQAVQKRDLAEAIRDILAGKLPSSTQTPSMGCSIKWKK